jgi:hypothetical protein
MRYYNNVTHPPNAIGRCTLGVEYAVPGGRRMDCIARLVKRVSNRRLRINVGR